MPNASPDLGRWSTVVSHISSVVDLETCARTPRALACRRGVRCAADLSHLTLLYGPGGLSLRSTTGFATSAGIAELCDASLLDRLRNAGDWLADVLDRLLVRKWGQAGTGSRFRLVLVDGSTESAPASKGSDWRLHATRSRRVGFHRPTYHRGDNGRGTVCVAVYPGDVLVQDRGYTRWPTSFTRMEGKRDHHLHRLALAGPLRCGRDAIRPAGRPART